MENLQRDAVAAGLPWTHADLKARSGAEPTLALPMLEKGARLANARVGLPTTRLGTASDDGPPQSPAEIVLETIAQDRWDEAEALLVKLEPALVEFRRAAEADVVLVADYDKAFWEFNTGMVEVREATKLLVASAVVLARRGEVQRALSELDSGFAIASLMLATPSFINELVGIALWAIASRGCIAVAEVRPDDIALMAELDRRLGQSVPFPDLRQTLRTEFYIGLATLRNAPPGYDPVAQLESGEIPEAPPEEPARSGWPTDRTMRGHMAVHLAFYTRLFEGMNANPAASPSELEDAALDYANQQSGGAAYVEDIGPWSVEPGWGRPIAADGQARYRALLAVARYRAENGAWPATLEQAGVLVEPTASPKAMRLRTRGDSATLEFERMPDLPATEEFRRR